MKSRSVSTKPRRLFHVRVEGYHVGHFREFVGTVYRTDGEYVMTANTTFAIFESIADFFSLQVHSKYIYKVHFNQFVN